MMRFFAMAIAMTVFTPYPAWAKHPQCAGSLEPEKCEKMRDEMAKETPAQRADRVKRHADSKADTDKAVAAQPISQHTQIRLRDDPKIGMSEYAAANSTWGKPSSINRTTTAYGVKEQWVYERNRYLYFRGGKLTTIQD